MMGRARYAGTATIAPMPLMTFAIRGQPNARAKGPRKNAQVAKMRPVTRNVAQAPVEPKRSQIADNARSCTAPAVPPAWTTRQRAKASGDSGSVKLTLLAS